MAAVGSMMLSLLSQGDEIVVHRTLYSNTMAMTGEGLPRSFRSTKPDTLDTALSPRTRIVYFEMSVNPTSDVLDISAIAAKAHRVGALVAVDSTFASPALQRPLEHGADLVLHSFTRYINGLQRGG